MKAAGSDIRVRTARAALLVLALAFALPAFALGLGRIVVKSAPGQPLVAEIPIVSADRSELENLQVRLASADTFHRVGLPAPDETTSNLQFSVAVDGGGHPVIRVTSAAPVRQPLLTFLVEVDWGAGRMVREYSALLEAPTSLAAPAQPIQAPVVGTPDTIGRAPEATAAAEAAPVVAEPLPEPAAPASPPAPAQMPMPDAGAGPPPVAPEPVSTEPPSGTAAAPAEPEPPALAPPPAVEPAPAPAAEPAAPPSPAPPPSSYTIQAGDTLGRIAGGMDRSGHSLDQLMLALLEANPEAFIDGNVNLIRQGAVLRTPPGDALARYSAGQAAALVRSQVAQWRQSAPASASAATVATGSAAGRAPASSASPPSRTASSDARLQIVPPASGEGTQSGIQAGGEGRMLRQEIQETQETLAARDAETGELKARVAELEKIQLQQKQLITMKDSALAEARANLAKAQAAHVPAASASPRDNGGHLLWPWLALALVVAAAAGWWLLRRRRDDPTRPRIFDAAAMAASVPRKSVAPELPVAPAPATAVPATTVAAAAVPATPAPAMAAPPAPSFVTAMPPDASTGQLPDTTSGQATTPPAPAPHWTAAPSLVGTVPPARAPRPLAEENASPARQVELARAYLDLGDEAAARELLAEALDGRDPVARDIAARMLRDLE